MRPEQEKSHETENSITLIKLTRNSLIEPRSWLYVEGTKAQAAVVAGEEFDERAAPNHGRTCNYKSCNYRVRVCLYVRFVGVMLTKLLCLSASEHPLPDAFSCKLAHVLFKHFMLRQNECNFNVTWIICLLIRIRFKFFLQYLSPAKLRSRGQKLVELNSC